jgi:NitT/TauT family transport system ATP-binding protein
MQIHNIHKTYNNLEVLRDISFDASPGKFYSILGPTGCGKSTLLNILAGMETPDGGEITFPTPKPQVGYLLQESVMLPWRTLAGNIQLSAEIKGRVGEDTRKKTSHYLERLGLAGFEDYYPDTLSGGMKQRASIIRCLITEPGILFLDEPFHSLDFDVKLRIQREILQYQQATNATIIMITHDIDDAIALSDKVIVLTAKPTIIKSILPIDVGLPKKDPVLARKSEKFPGYFAQLWDLLKYLENQTAS